MRKRLAFSLAELLVVMAIMTVLAGILLPVLVQAKGEAKEKQCFSHLHQLQLAISLYRTDNGGDGVFGKASQMGLPLDTTDLVTALSLPITTFQCTAPPNVLSPTQAVYRRFFTDNSAARGQLSWSDYTTSVGENAVIFADMNHGDRSVPITSPFYTHKGIGVRLNGQIFTETRLGDWSNLAWWEAPSP